MTTELKDRVRILVDYYWDGSVNRAASALGIPQQTLNRIATGHTPNPRATLVSKIASGSNVSLDWLLKGKGAGPTLDDAHGRPITGAEMRLNGVLDRLGAGDSLRSSVQLMAFGPFWAAGLLAGSSQSRSTKSLTREALEASLDTWADLLEAAIKESGARRVLKLCEENEPLVALGFSPFAMYLWEENPTMRSQLEAFYHRYSTEIPEVNQKQSRAKATPRSNKR